MSGRDRDTGGTLRYEELPEDHMMRKAYEQIFHVAVRGSGTVTWSGSE